LYVSYASRINLVMDIINVLNGRKMGRTIMTLPA
jgi:hypothetical protein